VSDDAPPAIFTAGRHERIGVAMVAEAVRHIESIMAGDDERAHAAEDMLRELVLRAIAEGRADLPEACAAIVLTTDAFDFARRYA
jgi:hypothetical protein